VGPAGGGHMLVPRFEFRWKRHRFSSFHMPLWACTITYRRLGGIVRPNFTACPPFLVLEQRANLDTPALPTIPVGRRRRYPISHVRSPCCHNLRKAGSRQISPSLHAFAKRVQTRHLICGLHACSAVMPKCAGKRRCSPAIWLPVSLYS
jgi:hypothetical protein